MIKYALKLIVFYMFLSSVSLVGQDTTRLTLDDCIEIALKNNSVLRNAKRRVDLARTGVISARSSVLPTVNTSFSVGKFMQGARIVKTDVPVGRDLQTGQIIYEQQEIVQGKTERNSHAASISLSQNIYDFGRSGNSIREAKAVQSSEEFNMQDTRLEVIFDVKQAYYQLLRDMHLLDVYEQAMSLSKEQVDEAQTRLDIGLASQAEVYQARVNLGRTRKNYINQTNQVEMAKANLNNALGRNPGIPVEVIEEQSDPIFTEWTFEQATEIAIENNKQIKAMEMEVKSYRFRINTEKSRYMPTIGAQISYDRRNNDFERVYSADLDRDFSATIGVGMDLNIFNGFADKAAIERQTLNYQIAVENLEESKRILRSNLKDIFLQLEALKDYIEINQENILAMKENLRLQQEKRRVGAGTELEVTQAQVNLTEAQSEYVRAEYEAKIQKSRLFFIMGLSETE
jgi:TolC family type I secretion outer membrane protein